MPKRKACWASWNFIGGSPQADPSAAVCVSYWVNHLQALPATAPDLFVTLNPPHPPKESTVYRKLSLSHPELGFASWRAQARIPEMQGTRGCIYYAGAWCGYGFHEDGMRAAVAVMDALGLPLPWVPRAASPRSTLFESYARRAVCRFARAAICKGQLKVVLPTGEEETFGEERSTPPQVPLRVMPSFLSAQPSGAGSGATAVHIDLSQQRADAADVWMAPGQAEGALGTSVRVLSYAAICAVATGGLRGLVAAYAARHYELGDAGAFCRALASNATTLVAEAGKLGWLHWVAAKRQLAEHHAAARAVPDNCMLVERLIDATGVLMRVRSVTTGRSSWYLAQINPSV